LIHARLTLARYRQGLGSKTFRHSEGYSHTV